MEHLIVNLFGPKELQLYTKLTELATDVNCSINQAQGQNLGTETVFSALITGHWGNIAKLETAIKSYAIDQGLVMGLKRSRSVSSEIQYLPYSVIVIALNKVGTIYNICNFFTTRKIVIELLQCETYRSNLTNTLMLSINLSISLPANTAIADLREQFILFCEDLNIDGILEPEKK
jgi:glycine cleavage system transcriptional repressor